jgi:hypothetical protein
MAESTIRLPHWSAQNQQITTKEQEIRMRNKHERTTDKKKQAERMYKRRKEKKERTRTKDLFIIENFIESIIINKRQRAGLFLFHNQLGQQK